MAAHARISHEGISPALHRVALLVCFSFLANLSALPAADAAPVLTFVDVRKDGVAGTDGIDGAISVAVAPDGANVYVAGLDDDSVAVFRRNAITGILTFVERKKDDLGLVDGLDGATGVVLSPDGAHLYVTGNVDDKLAVFSRDALLGALTIVDLHRDNLAGVDGLDGAYGVAVSPDGAHVYATGNVDDAVTVFSRNATTGVLTFIELEDDGVAGVDGLDGARGVAVSPDGANVYVSGNVDDAIAVFSRNPATGALTFVELEDDGVAGVDGLDGASWVAVSADGAHVYAASDVDDTVAVFSRNPATGALTFVELERDAVGGVDGLNGAVSVTLAAGGTYVYVGGRDDDAVAVFSRNTTTGALAFVEIHRDAIAGVDGLDGVQGIAVSPTGSHLYTAGSVDDGAAVFQVTQCGDGLMNAGEECDDGNTGNGDCCSSACAFEASGVACTDDGNSCTSDVCDATGTCTHSNTAAACDDGDACTVDDTCSGGACTGDPLDCDDSDACTDDTCNPASGCVNTPNTAACDDGDACTIDDACSGGTCNGAALDCNDGNACTADGCNPAMGCTATPSSGACDDGLFCTVDDACSGGLCLGAPLDCSAAADQCNTGACNEALNLCERQPEPDGGSCNDASTCTHSDACVDGSCVGLPTTCGDGSLQASCGEACDDGNLADGDGCSATCAIEPCGPTPAVGCLVPGAPKKAVLSLRNAAADARDALLWRWGNGGLLSKDDLGSPQATTDYVLCLYDATPRLLLSARVPAGAQCNPKRPRDCWVEGKRGFTYADRGATHDGIETIKLVAGPGKSTVLVKGRGPGLGMPPLPLQALPVTVQLKSVDGVCWDAVYSEVRVTGDRLRARSD